MLGGVETLLVDQAQASNRVEGVRLPQGQLPDYNLTLVVYARDNLGCEARSTLSADSVTPAYVISRPLSTSNTFSFLSTSASAILQQSLSEGSTSQALASITAMAAMLTAARDPCSNQACSGHGTCFQAVCTCYDGYVSSSAATPCDTALPPVDAVYTEWAPFGDCSRSCGGGEIAWTRTCTPPRHGGTPCDNSVDYRDCNAQPCTVVIDGGYSQWSEWSACSSSCPLGIAGYFPGTRTRTRACTNPPPSDFGNTCDALGAAVDEGML